MIPPITNLLSFGWPASQHLPLHFMHGWVSNCTYVFQQSQRCTDVVTKDTPRGETGWRITPQLVGAIWPPDIDLFAVQSVSDWAAFAEVRKELRKNFVLEVNAWARKAQASCVSTIQSWNSSDLLLGAVCGSNRGQLQFPLEAVISVTGTERTIDTGNNCRTLHVSVSGWSSQ